MTHRNLKPNAAKSLLESGEGWVYVDVRTEPEFEAGHAAGAWNVPFAVPDATGRMALNPQFLDVMRRIFPSDARLVLG
jgi:rhodanese-related sulfurtransferase